MTSPNFKSAILARLETLDRCDPMTMEQWQITVALLDICEAQAKALEDISADPPADQMKSWQTDSLIKVIEYDIDTAKAAITASNERLKRLAEGE